MFLWGCVTIGMAWADSYEHLIAFRVVIGCLEAGFGPGVLLMLSSWYVCAISRRFQPANFFPRRKTSKVKGSQSISPRRFLLVHSVVCLQEPLQVEWTVHLESEDGDGFSSSRVH
jgi:hypothetical protein